MIEIKIQLPIAPQKLIVTPGINKTVRPTIAAFTINVNSPRVTKINGRARIVAIGFTTVFTKENIKPAARYSQNEVCIHSEPSLKLPKKLMQMYIATLDTTQRIKNAANCLFIISLFYHFYFNASFRLKSV